MMIKDNKNSFFEKLFSFYNYYLLKRYFYRIHIDGEEIIKTFNENLPNLIIANHSNWWDGLIAFYFTKQRWHLNGYVMMDEEQLKNYRFFMRLGAFSVNRLNAKESIQSLKYAISLLKNKNNTLWIFPQGLLKPNNQRPIRFYRGIGKIIEEINPLNILCIALKYEFLMEQRPEVFIKLSNANLILNNNQNPKDIVNKLESHLTNELDKMKHEINNQNTEIYKTIVYGKNSVNKKLYGK
jgi:1-acyl-sn-glycerol-3-phosphate acyltransferase